MNEEKFLSPDFSDLETQEFTVTKADANKRLDVFLVEKLKKYSLKDDDDSSVSCL